MKYVNQLNYPEIPYTMGVNFDYDMYLKHKYLIDNSAIGKMGTFEPGMKPRIFEGNMAQAGCGLCCAIMVADRLFTDVDYDLLDTREVSYASGGNGFIGTDYEAFAPAWAEKIGAKLLMTNDLADVDRCLATGGVAVALSTGDREKDGYIGVFTHGAHYITLVSKGEDGMYTILDPSLKEGKYDEPGREGKVVVDGNIIYANGQTIDEDCQLWLPRFYCFWKK
ncbi:MAG: hypothetical protein HUJ80_08385 [Firmicutes bacterium]|nr:hypothetical protein [Bacillota bacterium]